MTRHSHRIAWLALLLHPGLAAGQVEVEITSDRSGIEVLFDNPVRIDSVIPSRIEGFVLSSNPRLPRALHAREVRASDRNLMPPNAQNYRITFDPVDGNPAFEDRDAEYTVFIDGVKSPRGDPIGDLRLSFTHVQPSLSFVDAVRLRLSDEEAAIADAPYVRFGGRAYVEVASVADRLDPNFVRGLDPYRQHPVDAQQVTVSTSSDKLNFRSVPVAGATINGQTIRLFLARGLPKGSSVYARVGLPKEDGTTLVVANAVPHVFAGPKGREDSQYFVALSYVSSANAGAATESRTQEGLLDLKVKPGPWRLFVAGQSYWVRRWQPLIDAKVGTDRPAESKSPNRVTLGLDLLFDRTVLVREGSERRRSWGEHRLRLGLLHNSDRDFETREAAIDLRWLPVPDLFVRSETLRLGEVRGTDAKATPRLRAWSVLPTLGVEVGEVLAAPAPTMNGMAGTSAGPKDGDEFLRYKMGLELTLLMARFTISLSDTLRWLDEAAGTPPDDWQNILEAGVTYQINALQGIGVKYQLGNDVPTFTDVDTFSVAYELKY